MADNNVINLDELAGKQLTGSNTFDMTSGIVKVEGPSPIDTAPRKVVPVMGTPFNAENMHPVDINALLPKKEKPSAVESSPLFAELDAAIEREKQSITERQGQIFDKMKEEVAAEEAAEETAQLDASIDGASAVSSYDNNPYYNENVIDDDEEIIMEVPLDVTVKHVTIDDNNDTEDVDIVVRSTNIEDSSILGYMNDDKLFDDTDENEEAVTAESAPSDEEMLNTIKAQVKDRLNTSTRKGIDLTKFTFAKKALSAQKVMKIAVTGHQNIADWVLPAANKTISMTGLSGPEILKLDANNSNRNRMNTFKDMYGILYKHVVDANKPEFEVWMKQLRFTDLQHVYFAAYMATFNGSSFTNYSCPHCSNVFIHDIEFKDLVKYKDDNAKARIHELLKRDSTSTNPDTYEAELVQISDKYAFAIRTPSIWNTVIEIATLSDKFLETHADLIDLIAYIDGVYLINYETLELVPVDTKPDPNDMGKTVARRVKSIYDIIGTLSSDEYSTLRSAIASIEKNTDDITYKLPGCTCPKCNKEIPDNNNITPEQLLFTRHQLAAIANMSN